VKNRKIENCAVRSTRREEKRREEKRREEKRREEKRREEKSCNGLPVLPSPRLNEKRRE